MCGELVGGISVDEFCLGHRLKPDMVFLLGKKDLNVQNEFQVQIS